MNKNVKLGVEGARCLGMLIGECPDLQLKTLSIINCEIGEKGASHILEGIRKNKALEELYIVGCGIPTAMQGKLRGAWCTFRQPDKLVF